MKKILYIGSFILPDKDAAAKRVMTVANYFKKEYEVVFLSGNHFEDSLVNNYIDGFKVYGLNEKTSYIKWFKYLFSIKNIKKIVSIEKDIKLIICYNYPSFAMKKLIKFCKKNNIKLITDCTEWYEKEKKICVKSILKNIDIDQRMKKINKKCDGIICVSSYIKKYYQDYVPTIIIPTISDLSKYKSNKQSHSFLNFVYCGDCGQNFSKERLDIIIYAMEKLYKDFQFQFTIIGVTLEKLYDYGLNKREYPFVNAVGKKYGKELIELLNFADFSIIAREEKINTVAGFPTKFSESISLCTPVIATNVGDISKYLIDGYDSFIVDKCDIDSFYVVLNNVLNLTENDLAQMKKNCENNKLLNIDFSKKISDFLEMIIGGIYYE